MNLSQLGQGPRLAIQNARRHKALHVGTAWVGAEVTGAEHQNRSRDNTHSEYLLKRAPWSVVAANDDQRLIRYFCLSEMMYAARSPASDGRCAARAVIFGCGVSMVASNDADVVVVLLAISVNDGALVHPFLCVVTPWHWLQTFTASLCPSDTSAAWATGPTAMANPQCDPNNGHC
jgi:hypothetical protein